MKNSGYPNIERFAHLVDTGLGLVFALIRMGVFLVVALILVALIVYCAATGIEGHRIVQVYGEVQELAIEEWLAAQLRSVYRH